jgi:hypothetical protein
MPIHRVIALVAVLIVAGVSEAAAQFIGAPPRQANPCDAFVPIRQETEKHMVALQTANERKAPREEFCQIFQRLSVATGKIAKFLEQNKTLCNVPAEAVQRAKADYGKSLTYRKQACSAAPAAAGPSLSDVLGAPLLPDATTTAKKPGGSTFDTLTGNPLAR